MDNVVLAAAAATALSTWQLVPQVARSLRTRSTLGLSPTWAAIGAAVNIGWLAYRWSQGLWLSMLSPAITAALFISLLWLIPSHPRRPNSHAQAGVAFSLLLAALLGGWPLVGTALASWAAVQILPAVWSAYRTRGGLAVAPGLWIVGLGQAVLWGYYGSSVGDPALVLYGVAMGTGSALILARLVARPSTARRSSAPPAGVSTPLPAGGWAWALVFRQPT